MKIDQRFVVLIKLCPLIGYQMYCAFHLNLNPINFTTAWRLIFNYTYFNGLPCDATFDYHH